MSLCISDQVRQARCSSILASILKGQAEVERLTAMLQVERIACTHPAAMQVYEPYVLFGSQFKGWALTTCSVCTAKRIDMHAGKPGHCPHKGATHPVVSGDEVCIVCDICDADVAR